VVSFFRREVEHFSTLVNHVFVFVESVRSFVAHYTSLVSSLLRNQLGSLGEHHSLSENFYLLSLTALNNMGHAAAPATPLNDKDYALMKSVVEFLTRSSFLFFSHVRGLETIEVFEERLNVEAEIQKSIETFTTFSSMSE
jgi:hypothetical protein